MTTKPTERRRRANRVVAGGVTLLVGITSVAWFASIRSNFYGTYICARCGAEERTDRRSVVGIAYHEDRTIRETAVSRALTAGGERKCQHEWYLSRCARSWGSLFEWQAIADGGLVFSVMRQLLDDEGFAHELREMPNGREVWSALSKAEQASPRETERLLGEWWIEGQDRGPFDQWWEKNHDRVEQLGGGESGGQH